MSKKRGRTLTLGVIIGFFIGLFLAPKKGTELRQDAKKKIDTIKENPKDVLHETFEDVKDKVSKLKEDLSEDKIWDKLNIPDNYSSKILLNIQKL